MPALSVIIPSYNGVAKLPWPLGALARQQQAPAFEVIVVVDGSTDGTEADLAARHDPYPLRVHTQANGGRAAARNAGAALAQAPILVFFDDDIVPPPDALARHHAFHQQHENAILGGHAQQAMLDTDVRRWKHALEARWRPANRGLHQTEGAMAGLTSQNLSLPKAVFDALQGFDTALRDGEDFDLGLRAHGASIPVWHDASLDAAHMDAISMASLVRRRRAYIAENRRLISLRPQFAHILLPHRSLEVDPRKKALMRPFAQPGLVRAIDQQAAWVRALPRPLRWQLYERVLWALGFFYPETPLDA